jgi:hypothetical protein
MTNFQPDPEHLPKTEWQQALVGISTEKLPRLKEVLLLEALSEGLPILYNIDIPSEYNEALLNFLQDNTAILGARLSNIAFSVSDGFIGVRDITFLEGSVYVEVTLKLCHMMDDFMRDLAGAPHANPSEFEDFEKTLKRLGPDFNNIVKIFRKEIWSFVQDPNPKY